MLGTVLVERTVLQGDVVESIGARHIAVGNCHDVEMVTSEVELEMESNP